MGTTVRLTIGGADPKALAQFWTTAPRYVPEPPTGGHETWESWLAATGPPAPGWFSTRWNATAPTGHNLSS